LVHHQTLHAGFKQGLSRFLMDYKREKVSASDLSEMMMSWLMNHILIEDKKYIEMVDEDEYDLPFEQ
ncbi:MAG: hypothetical protein HQL48_01950, partial [Gammaproteobacteria bacterium]|nr:hypothetical protein [Gammaproteobacteria bacterium]